jgi:hypothetical protein
MSKKCWHCRSLEHNTDDCPHFRRRTLSDLYAELGIAVQTATEWREKYEDCQRMLAAYARRLGELEGKP